MPKAMFAQLKNYLSVTKKQWNGLVVLAVLIALVLAAPYAYQLTHKSPTINLNGFNAAVARLKQTTLADSNQHNVTNAKLFAFNPNHLPGAQWQKLGLSLHQIQVINNYEAKGGRFYTKQDLQKIYSITAADYQRLAPHISLPDREAYKAKATGVIELNTANEAKLTQLRGIGDGYAKLIIRYRDRLGGFYKKEQLKEVYGLDSVTYADILPMITIDAAKITKMNINKATMNSLQVFPYLTYKQKNALVEYRNQHGDYAALADLKNIPLFDDQILRKIEPYFSFK